jgi:glycosyltransferase involved in cell wall biosynthesis
MRGRAIRGGRGAVRLTTTTPIRVLHIVTWLGVGGAERLVLMAATGLPRATFESAVCCFVARGPFADEAERQQVKVWCLGAFPSFRHPAALYRLYRIIRAFRPDIVHTHLQAPNLYGRLMALAARVPVVIASEHNVYASKARRHVWMERILAQRTSALVAVSEPVRRFLAAQLRLDPSAIDLVRNGIAAPVASPAGVDALRRRLALPDGELVLGTVASLTAKKGHTFLLQAMALLRDRGLRCALILAGEGPQRAPLEAQAATLGLADRVRFLGVHAQVGDVLALVDVFVLPSITEGLPLALLEAMAAGKAVVATAVGGVPDVITSGTNGLLVPPQAVPPLADALQSMLADSPRRLEYGERARTTVLAGFTEEQHLHSLGTLYLSLLNRAEPRPA